MAKSNWRTRRESARHMEPGHEALGGCAGRALGLKFHFTFRAAKAQACERVDDHAQPVIAAQVLVPERWRVAVHAGQKIHEMQAAQRLLDFAGQLQRALYRPLRQHAGMHQQPAFDLQGHVLVANPVQPGGILRRLQDRIQGVTAVLRAQAVAHHQQVQVVVAEQAPG